MAVGTKKGEGRGKGTLTRGDETLGKAAPEAFPPKHACETQGLWATRREVWQRYLVGMLVNCATGLVKGHKPVPQPTPVVYILESYDTKIFPLSTLTAIVCQVLDRMSVFANISFTMSL